MFDRRHRSARPLAAVALTSLILAACGSNDADSVARPAATASEAGPDSPSDDAAVLASVFANATPIDGSFDGGTLEGTHSVLWFWAPWCTICRAEAPDIISTAERYGDQVNFVGVGGRGALDEMRSFIDDTGTGELTHVADLGGEIWQTFGIYAQPAFAFIDDDGTVDVFTGGLGEDDLAERIEELTA